MLAVYGIFVQFNPSREYANNELHNGEVEGRKRKDKLNDPLEDDVTPLRVIAGKFVLYSICRYTILVSSFARTPAWTAAAAKTESRLYISEPIIDPDVLPVSDIE
jgi:hypothetical protein